MWIRLRASVSRLFFLLTRRRIDEDARLEIDAHLDLLTERYLRQGLSPDDAYITPRLDDARRRRRCSFREARRSRPKPP
jgi:hypothetical protein